MGMIRFDAVAGQRAIDETRTATVIDNPDLPSGEYAFVEYFCNDRKCDCRRAIFNVIRKNGTKIYATITYGWDTAEYYGKWSGAGLGEIAQKMASATLEPHNPQSSLAPALLKLFIDEILPSPGYLDRLKRHYSETCPTRMSGAMPHKPTPQYKKRKR
jgi:hypothetical protein